mgnify:CR=1 FL=1
MTLQSNGKEKTNMMKFGLLTSICEGMTFEEVVDFAAENQDRKSTRLNSSHIL